MAVLLPIALVYGFVAVYLLAQRWYLPWTWIPKEILVSVAFAGAASVVAFGLVFEFLIVRFSLFDLSSTLGVNVFATLLAALPASWFIWARLTKVNYLRAGSILLPKLRASATHTDAKRTLTALLSRAVTSDPLAHVKLTLASTNPLTEANDWELARTWLLRSNPDKLTHEQRDAYHQAIAACQMHVGDVDGARRAIDAITQRPASESIEIWLRAMEALLLAIDGRAVDALEAANAIERASDDASVRASVELIRAHAHAAANRTSECKAAIRRVHGAAGRSAVERLLRPRGPATDIAEAWLRTHASTERA